VSGAPVRHALHLRVERERGGSDVFGLARIMGTSVRMIQRHYGTPISGATAGIAARLAAFEDTHERARDRASDDES
jgi:hypothetical protein